MKFADLRLAEPVLRSLQSEGYENPTPIQAQAIPDVLTGHDLLGSAQTGTGKTAAFALPILTRFANNPKTLVKHDVRCLVLAPTRELAVQIDESFRVYGRHLKLKHAVVFGGVSQHGQAAALSRGVDVLVATPGRLLDLMNQNIVSLAHVEVFVLDEADRMLDMGFINDIRKIVAKLPRHRQTLMFSATMPPDIRDLAETILNNPVSVQVNPVASTVQKIDQSVYFVSRQNKPQLLAHLINNTAISRALVFTRTKHGADRVVRQLYRSGIKAEAIHGNKSQNARQRALQNFKNGRTPVLVASDLAARGIDVDDISHVFNYDLTHEPETYVHRIGRTARAGAEGHAVSFCDSEERSNLHAIERLIKQKIRVNTDQPVYRAPDPQEARSREDDRQPSRHQQSGRSHGSHRASHSQRGSSDRGSGERGSGNRSSSNRQSNTERSHPRQPSQHLSGQRANHQRSTGAAASNQHPRKAPSHSTQSARPAPESRGAGGNGNRSAQGHKPKRALHPLDRNRNRQYTSGHAKHR